MSIPVEPLSYIGVMAVMIVVIWKLYNKIVDKHNKDIKELTNDFRHTYEAVMDRHKHDHDKISEDCLIIRERLTVMETKQDINLYAAGFDIGEVNEAIENSIEELKKNDKPSVGCIHVDKLKRRKEG